MPPTPPSNPPPNPPISPPGTPPAPAPEGRGRIHARAHAKVNLALAVGPPVPPGQPGAGYHPIASWMHAIELGDDITLARAGTTRYDLAWHDESPLGWDPESDLCVRAHRALESLAGRTLPAEIRVRKSVPAGAGLGGGSSDAGVVLLALRDLFDLGIDDQQLIACAHALGTDIPFFIDPDAWRAGHPPRPALVTALGERTERLPRRADAITLICPPFGCPTGAVYRAFDARPARPCDEARVRLLASTPGLRPDTLFNDLGAPAEQAEPRLRPLRGSLARAIGAPVHLSGSGSTLFCFEPPDAVAPHAPGCRVIGTRLV